MLYLVVDRGITGRGSYRWRTTRTILKGSDLVVLEQMFLAMSVVVLLSFQGGFQ
jgi:hypothetical protein